MVWFNDIRLWVYILFHQTALWLHSPHSYHRTCAILVKDGLLCACHIYFRGIVVDSDRPITVMPDVQIPEQEKREGFQDNATGKKEKFITDSSQGPLLHPMQWYRSERPEPKLLHKFIGWAHAVGLSGLVTSLQSNFIGQNFRAAGLSWGFPPHS